MHSIDHPEKIGISLWDKDDRGTALNDVDRVNFDWYYNWDSRPLWDADATPERTHHIPMVWDETFATEQILAQIKASGATTLLGFNEPDDLRQANMSVEQAIALWPQLQATGLRLGSPATTKTGALGPDSWLGRFMAEADKQGLQVDFISVHYYSTDGDVNAFKAWLEAVHKQYNKPIWVTEWVLADWNNPGRFTAAEQAAFARAGSEMMDDLPFVERQSWFAAYEGGDGWYLNSGLFDADNNLTPVGRVFAELNGLTADPIFGGAPAAGLDIFRFYNTQTGTHFYTASKAERDFVQANHATYSYEGNAFDATASEGADVTVFRFYNTETGTHFYTANEAERDQVIAQYKQYAYEGVAYEAYGDAGGGEHTALYRFYNEQTGTHFYTASDIERQNVVDTLPQFKYEGIAYYVDLA